MIDKNLTQNNQAWGNSKYATDFDYLMHDYVLQRLRPFFKGDHCAELGCYKGEMTKKLAKEFERVTAIDIEPKYCEHVRELGLGNVDVSQSDFAMYDDYNKFSDVISIHSLEHVEFDQELLNFLSKNKASDALVHIVVPNGTSLSRRIAVNMGFMAEPLVVTDFEKAIGHHRTYDIETLIAVVEGAGLTIVHAGGIMPKVFSNSQYDRALQEGIIGQEYLDAAFKLSEELPELCSSIFVSCR
ncbi:MAG: class I SAM-dependent methyltransferase [Halopseudomonas aestusnigri]